MPKEKTPLKWKFETAEGIPYSSPAVVDGVVYFGNAAGEVSNMIALVKSMIGDTLILNWEFYDWIYGNFGESVQIVIVLD